MKEIVLVLLVMAVMIVGVSFLSKEEATHPTVMEIPTAVGHINDFAQVLSPEKRGELETFLDGKTPEIAVLTIDSTHGEAIEEYAVRVANAWGVGSAENDDGILFVVATEDRQMRVEIGSGAEGVLTDAQAGRILDEYVVPELKNNNWEAGITNGVYGLWTAINQ